LSRCYVRAARAERAQEAARNVEVARVAVEVPVVVVVLEEEPPPSYTEAVQSKPTGGGADFRMSLMVNHTAGGSSSSGYRHLGEEEE